MSRIVPVTAFTTNATHSIGTKPSVFSSGMPGAKPRMRKSIALLPPASNPIQMVWTVLVVGNAQRHSPRFHSLKALLSIQAKTGSIGLKTNLQCVQAYDWPIHYHSMSGPTNLCVAAQLGVFPQLD